MSYKTKAERATEFFRKEILPILNNQDLDYEKVISIIQAKTQVNRRVAKETIDLFVGAKQVKEIRLLTIPDEKIVDWLKDLKEEKPAEETKEEDTPVNNGEDSYNFYR